MNCTSRPIRLPTASSRVRRTRPPLAAIAGVVMLAACSPAEQPGPAPHPDAVAGHVTVQVCGKAVRYDRVPERAITHDVNITEIFLYLGLGDKLVGYSGIADPKTIAPEYRAQLARVPNLSDREMNLETIIGARADFVFGGWSYGFREGGVTPDRLLPYGIQSYILTESCIRKQARKRVSIEDTFADMRNLGRIFRIEAHAEALVAAQQADLADIAAALEGIRHRPKVFVYDSGIEAPTTSGRFGMPNAMIEAAGGRNIFDDIQSSWPKGNWEDVVARNPDWIVIVDYDPPGPQGKIDFLLRKPELTNVTAIRERRFVVLDYAEATPGPRNVARTRTLARAFHPERFP